MTAALPDRPQALGRATLLSGVPAPQDGTPLAVWCPRASSLLPEGSGEGLDVTFPWIGHRLRSWSQGAQSPVGELDGRTDDSRTAERGLGRGRCPGEECGNTRWAGRGGPGSLASKPHICILVWGPKPQRGQHLQAQSQRLGEGSPRRSRGSQPVLGTKVNASVRRVTWQFSLGIEVPCHLGAGPFPGCSCLLDGQWERSEGPDHGAAESPRPGGTGVGADRTAGPGLALSFAAGAGLL